MDQLLPRLWTPVKKSPPSLPLFICVACQGSTVAMITAVLDFLFLRFFCRKLLYILVNDINRVFFVLLGIIQMTNLARPTHPQRVAQFPDSEQIGNLFGWVQNLTSASDDRWPMYFKYFEFTFKTIYSYGDIVVPLSVTMNCAPILYLSGSDEKLSFSIATLCPVQKELTTSDVIVALFKIEIVSGQVVCFSSVKRYRIKKRNFITKNLQSPCTQCLLN